MKHLKTKFLIKELAREEGLTAQGVENIISSHFEFVRFIMTEKVNREETYFPSVRLKNFAIFYCTENRKKWMKKLNSKNRNGTSTI